MATSTSASAISVLIVEDSPVAVTILQRIFSSSPDIHVVGIARNGVEALELIPKVQPKVICTDFHMPKMNGLELTERVMAEYPRPILVISSSVDKQDDADNVFQLLQAGALDVFLKPSVESASEYEQIKQELITRIKVLSGVSMFTQHRSRLDAKLERAATQPPQSRDKPRALDNAKPLEPRSFTTTAPTTASSTSKPSQFLIPKSQFLPRVLAIGASTGGPQALHTILKALPANFPVPILCVQHISEGFLVGLTTWLASQCKLPVVVAQAGELPKPGTVYFAPDCYHLQLTSQGRFMLSNESPVSGHRPSVTMLFQSVATYYRQATMSILLTGMGRDGAEGLLAIAQAGGTTIAQDEQSCVVFGMPKEAIALGAAQTILPLTEIAPTVLRQFALGHYC